jgi:hypothetical protein
MVLVNGCSDLRAAHRLTSPILGEPQGVTEMNLSLPTGIGAVIAVVVLILAVVFVAIGQMDFKVGILLAALAVARLT